MRPFRPLFVLLLLFTAWLGVRRWSPASLSLPTPGRAVPLPTPGRAVPLPTPGRRADGDRIPAAERRPVLLFSTTAVELGALQAGSDVVASVDWRCEGRGSLRVLALRPDCRCAEASGLGPRLEAGDQGRLRVRLKVPRRGGVLRARVRIVTDGPPGQDVHTLCLSGVVTGDWQFEPAALDLGRWAPGRMATRTVALEGPLEVVAGLERRLLEPRIEGFAGRVGILPPARAAPGAHARLRLDIRIPEAEGLHHGYLLVHVPEGEARLLPIRCTVAAPGGQQPLFPHGKGSPAESEHIQNAHDVQVPDTTPLQPGAEPAQAGSAPAPRR